MLPQCEETHTFDSFECAIHKLAPVCEHCDCKIVGHGIERDYRLITARMLPSGSLNHAALVFPVPCTSPVRVVPGRS